MQFFSGHTGDLRQRTLIYFVRGSITVLLTSCLTGLDSVSLLMFNQQKINLFDQIETGLTRLPLASKRIQLAKYGKFMKLANNVEFLKGPLFAFP